MQKDYFNEIEEIVEELEIMHINNIDKSKVEDIFSRFLKKAINITNNKNYDDLLPYVKDATVAFFNIKGSEGMKSRSEGERSTTFSDITADMKNNLISAGLRRLK